MSILKVALSVFKTFSGVPAPRIYVVDEKLVIHGHSICCVVDMPGQSDCAFNRSTISEAIKRDATSFKISADPVMLNGVYEPNPSVRPYERRIAAEWVSCLHGRDSGRFSVSLSALKTVAAALPARDRLPSVLDGVLVEPSTHTVAASNGHMMLIGNSDSAAALSNDWGTSEAPRQIIIPSAGVALMQQLDVAEFIVRCYPVDVGGLPIDKEVLVGRFDGGHLLIHPSLGEYPDYAKLIRAVGEDVGIAIKGYVSTVIPSLHDEYLRHAKAVGDRSSPSLVIYPDGSIKSDSPSTNFEAKASEFHVYEGVQPEPCRVDAKYLGIAVKALGGKASLWHISPADVWHCQRKNITALIMPRRP
jgi:hypothetical protein